MIGLLVTILRNGLLTADYMNGLNGLHSLIRSIRSKNPLSVPLMFRDRVSTIPGRRATVGLLCAR